MILAVLTFILAGFDSIQAQNQDKEWVEVLPANTSVEIDMPNEPKYRTRTMTPNDVEIVVHSYVCSVDEGRVSYFLVHHDLPEMPETEIDKKRALDSTIEGSVARVAGTLRLHKEIKINKNPGREFIYEFENDDFSFRIHSRIYLRRKRIFQLNVVAIEENYSKEDAKKYFDSFKLTSRLNPPREKEEENDDGDSDKLPR